MDKNNVHLSSREVFVINNAFTAKRAYFSYCLGQLETQRNEVRDKNQELFTALCTQKKAILEKQRELIKLQKKLSELNKNEVL